MAILIDPLQALKKDRAKLGIKSASEIVKAPSGPPSRASVALAGEASTQSSDTLEGRAKADFRVFLILIWRLLLKVDPSPIQLDMAYYLQHGPKRTIIMAFRGFSKSWITGAYALWLLYVDADEKILVVSGNLGRAIATTSWCLNLILMMPLLKDLRPKTHNRQSGQMFDVGNCVPAQSASFMAAGIGGQLVGFRGTCIIPDDVETQTNSLTSVMRTKNLEAVKEFESVLTPGGSIKYLGTPHDRDSLYLSLGRLRNADGSEVYNIRIWPCYFPTEAEIKSYGTWLAPFITTQIRKHGPSIVGTSTMPNRFTESDLAKRRAAMGNSEFRLQFMLDLKGGFLNKNPLKFRDLTVMDLDPRMGPSEVIWGTTHVYRDLPLMGHDGDFFYGPVPVDEMRMVKYSRVIGHVDSSGRGTNETALVILAELYGKLYWLHLWASTDGYGETTLQAIANACVRFGVHTLFIEDNFGDGLFTALMRPVLIKAWQQANSGRRDEEQGGTSLEETKAGRMDKERRILSILEPITQGHRLVVSRAVIEWDYESMMAMDGEDSRHRYAWGYQYTHLTQERDSLALDDRLDALAGACGVFAQQLGVDPRGMASKAQDELYSEELAELMREEETAVGRSLGAPVADLRPEAGRPQKR